MVIHTLNFGPEEHVVPHAIIWRPIEYFTVAPKEGRDDLDAYQGASFAIGNEVHFDLRRYRGHPGLTVTLYFSESVTDEREISAMLDEIFRQMFVPITAVAWRRGEPFKFGELKRRPDDRLREDEARILVLKIAAQQPGYTASTSFLKKEAPKYTELSLRDRVLSPSRRGEEKWQQIVGNVLSHQETAAGPFVQGYALRTGNGLSVTAKGLRYLNSMGFSNFPTGPDPE